jgi:hypothetical protein
MAEVLGNVGNCFLPRKSTDITHDMDAVFLVVRANGIGVKTVHCTTIATDYLIYRGSTEAGRIVHPWLKAHDQLGLAREHRTVENLSRALHR